MSHIERIEKEAAELSEKIDALADFIGSQIFITLTPRQQRLLETQLEIMEAYLGILETRLLEENS